MTDVGRAGVRAVKWSAVTTAGRFALQLVAQVILARLLGPENYGIFGIGLVVYTFSNFVAGFGFGWSLLQRSSLSDEDIRFAFTWQVIAGGAAMAALYWSAPLVAVYFHEPRVQPVVEWLSLACLLSAAMAPASNLLQRELDFRAVGLVQIGSYALGYLGVGIPMALAGQGALALVAAWLTQATTALLATFALRPHSLRPLFWYPGAKTAFGTGGAVFLTNVVNWLLNNLDRVMVGRLLNPLAVGLYSAGYNLATMPSTVLLGALQPAFLAAGARLQEQTERLGRAYFQIVAAVWVLLPPVFVCLALASGDLVRLLYGERWADTAWVLGILYLSIPAYVTWGLSTPILWNTGRKFHESLLQLPVLIGGALCYYSLVGYGIQAAAMVAALLMVSRCVVVAAVACEAVGLRVKVFAPHAARGIVLSAIAGGAFLVGQQAVPAVGLPLLALLAGCSSALLAFCGAILAFPRLLGDQAAAMVVRFVPRLQDWSRRALPVSASCGCPE